MNSDGVFASWPLIGRESEMQRIAAARARGAVGVVISAPAGVGKTRLAERAVELAGQQGQFTTWVRGTRSFATIPTAAFAHIIPREARVADGPRFFGACADALREQAGGRQIVIGVDDAHLLDAASAALLLHLSDHAGAFTVATVRLGEACPDAVTTLWKDGGAVVLQLRELEDVTLVQLAETVLGAPLAHDARRWLTVTSQGNLLFARLLLTSAVETGALIADDELWRLVRTPSPGLTLRELTAERIGTLTAGERAGMELLALSEPLPLVRARAVIAPDILVGLEERRLITLQGGPDDGSVRFAHPLYSELVSTEMPRGRAYEHRIALAALYSDRDARSLSDDLRLARWQIDAGEPVARETLVNAAQAALLGGLELAEQYAELAIRAGAGVRARMMLAGVRVVQGHPADAESILAAAEGTITDPDLALRYLRQWAVCLVWELERGADAIALLDRARRWWPDRTWQQRVEVLRLGFAAEIATPGSVSAELVDSLASDTLTTDGRRWLTRTHAADQFWSGHACAGATIVSECFPRLPLADDLAYLELGTYVVVHVHCGADLPELERSMLNAFERASTAADPAAAGLAALTVAIISYLAGRLLDARRWLNEAEMQCRRQNLFSVGTIAASLRLGIAFASGDRGKITRCEQPHPPDPSRPRWADAAVWLARGRAWSRLAEAEPRKAQEILMTTAKQMDWGPVFAAELLYEAMRAGRAARSLSAAAERCAQRTDAPLTAAYAKHIAARAAAAPTSMLAAAHSFAALGVNLYAAEAAAHAAAAFAAEGRQDSARQAAALSRRLQPDDQGATPLVIDGVDRALTELTAREAQLVELAALGLTNPQIAERLVLSPRTVETHIYRAMRKLGVSDRRKFSSLGAHRSPSQRRR